jgi:hypothetical protein
VRAEPPFIGIELDISDSGREGCSVSMLTITAQPVHWQETVQVRTAVTVITCYSLVTYDLGAGACLSSRIWASVMIQHL